ncbi:MAG: ABC transporter substrate-binding protein, partial [Alphaproteobacteria bacterium]
VRRGQDGRFRPALAESWTVSEDARTWTFRLKPGLRFHNGDVLDAAAAAFSIRRMQRPDIGATLGAPGVWRQYLAEAEVDALDDSTLRIALTTPMADLLDILVSGYVLPPELADRKDFLKSPVGSGAYRAVEISGDFIRMAANPNWQGGAVAHADVVWRRMPSPRDRIGAVASGEAHVATRLDPGAASAAGLSAVDYVDPVSI